MRRDTRERFKTKNDAEVIKIRFREGRGGAWSIYFDTYINGKRQKEAIGRELIPERTPLDKIQNDDVMTAVRAMRAKRIQALAEGEDIFAKKQKKSMTLHEYITSDPRRFKDMDFLIRLTKDMDIRVSSVTSDDVKRIIDRIEDGHYKNSVQNLLVTIKRALRFAVADGILDKVPYMDVKELKSRFLDAKQMTFLSKEELASMEALYEGKMPREQKNILRLFLFSCYTSLRKSDIRDLKVKDIVLDNGRPMYIHKTQVKTRKSVMIPLNNKAISYLPDLTDMNPDDNVFSFGKLFVPASMIVDKIREKAGITRHITFHTARHTFATLALSLGGDVYTVSKLLGHSSVKTTEIYAKVVDEKKKTVTDLFDKL